jgi:hypothetical protein
MKVKEGVCGQCGKFVLRPSGHVYSKGGNCIKVRCPECMAWENPGRVFSISLDVRCEDCKKPLSVSDRWDTGRWRLCDTCSKKPILRD